MPPKKEPVKAKTPVAPVTPVAPTPVDTSSKKGQHLQSLQNKLDQNASFMRMMGWTVAILALVMSMPYVFSIIEAFVWPIIKLPFWYFGMANWPFGGAGPLTNAATSLIFGTQTTSGLPIALVKGLLPAFMAPAAVWVAFGVPLLLFAYQYAYVNWNENYFAPKPNAAALERDRKKGQPDPKDTTEPKQGPDNTALPPKTVTAPSTVNTVPQGKSPILDNFKSKVQATREARARKSKAVKAAPKRRATKKTISKKAAPKKAAPRKAAPKKAAPRKAAPRKIAKKSGKNHGYATKEKNPQKN